MSSFPPSVPAWPIFGSEPELRTGPGRGFRDTPRTEGPGSAAPVKLEPRIVPDPVRDGRVRRMTTTRPPGPRDQHPDRTPEDPETGPPKRVVVAVRRLFQTQTREYFVLLATTLFLVGFGLVMVLSSSAIQSHVADGDFFSRAARQAVFAVVGVPLMLIASRFPITFWKRWAWHFLGLGIVLQLLVFTGLGFGYGGNTNWISIAGVSMQPSEFVKLALVVWLATVLAKKGPLLNEWRHIAIPVAPVAILAIGLVLLGNDLGTAIIMLALTLGALFYAGVRLRYLALVVVLVAAAGFAVAQLSSSRRDRIEAWLTGCTRPEDYELHCWQTIHGWEALANGGLFGVGLGNSEAKWLWLPHAESDFIFAIIGEEFGMAGAIVVLGLFTVIAITMVRIARKNSDPFAKIATSSVLVWIISQAFVNIAVVLGVLPVLGVPLPLMSAGGSALLATMLAIGVVLSFARERPETVDEVARLSDVRRPRSGR